MYSIFDMAKTKPDTWIKKENCQTSEHHEQLSEAGGMVQWCSCCNMFNTPNSPCICGCLVIQRKDGFFWGGENGWVKDWKFLAEHFFSSDSATEVARVLCNDNGPLGVYSIHTNWKEKPLMEVR